MITTEQVPIAIVLALSILVQAGAAVMAVRLITMTGHRLAWSLIAGALTLMAVRRVVPLVRLLAGDPDIAPDPLNEVIGLVLSLLMAGGIARVAPIFRERLRMEDQLQEREQRVTRLIDESPLGMVVSAGADETVQLINRKFTELFGYTMADMPDVAHWWPLAYPDAAYRERIRAQWAEKIARATTSRGTVEPMEATVTCRDGSTRDIEFHLSTLGDRHLVTFIDLTARKQAEHRVHESEERLRLTMEATQIGIWDWDIRNDHWYASPTYYTMLGYSPENGLADRGAWLERVHPDDRASVSETIRKVLAQDFLEYHYEARLRHADGSYRWMDVRGFGIERDADGKVTRMLGTRMDISDRKRAEAALKENEEKYRLLHENAGVGIGYYTPDGRVLSFNRLAAEYMGGNPENFTGKSIFEIFPKPEADKYLERVRQAAATGVTREYEDHVTLPAASKWFLSVFVRICNAQGDVTGVQIISKDVSERRLAEQELQRHRDHLEELVAARTTELEAANRELESFSYSVSHDLRTPLRAIDGFSHMLASKYSGSLDAEANRLIRVVRQNSAKMSRLIDDILAFSRTGRTEMRHLDVNMGQLVRDAWTDLEPLRVGRQIRFEAGTLPPARGDPSMLRQVWANLLGNAVKFTRHVADARIEVGGEITGSEYTYFVRDNGVGFDPAYAHKLFGVFQRLHGVQEFEGTGIGLAIVKRIVTRHGGRVDAEGAVGRGTTFRFTLPVMETET
jgi:PAS domain S-box-containing protein